MQLALPKQCATNRTEELAVFKKYYARYRQLYETQLECTRKVIELMLNDYWMLYNIYAKLNVPVAGRIPYHFSSFFEHISTSARINPSSFFEHISTSARINPMPTAYIDPYYIQMYWQLHSRHQGNNSYLHKLMGWIEK